MIRWLLVPFFIIYLLTKLLGWVMLLLASKYQRVLNILSAGAFVLLLIFITWQVIVTAPHLSPTPDPLEPYRQQLRETQLLLNKQPTHRDLLWNAAVLSQKLGDASASAEYYQRAIQVDPSLSPLP